MCHSSSCVACISLWYETRRVHASGGRAALPRPTSAGGMWIRGTKRYLKLVIQQQHTITSIVYYAFTHHNRVSHPLRVRVPGSCAAEPWLTPGGVRRGRVDTRPQGFGLSGQIRPLKSVDIKVIWPLSTSSRPPDGQTGAQNSR